MRGLARLLLGGLRTAVEDLLAALEAVLHPGLPWGRLLAPPALGLAAGWFSYVPTHEMLHAAGCLATGGSVTELSLAPWYGARLLAPVFPFVVASREEPARLTGFSTGGSDLVYLATDLAPYLLTILVGVPLLRGLRRPDASWWGWKRWAFGPAVILAAAPFIGLPGDYYEMASILITMPLADGYRVLRSDDLIGLLGERQLWTGPGAPARAVIVSGSSLLALMMAGWTYRLGVLWADARSRGGGRHRS